jgi:hypothetical protein
VNDKQVAGATLPHKSVIPALDDMHRLKLPPAEIAGDMVAVNWISWVPPPEHAAPVTPDNV